MATKSLRPQSVTLMRNSCFSCTVNVTQQQREDRPREEVLREYWNFSEGGLLCTKQAASQVFCPAISRITESTVLAGLLCTLQTTFTYVSNPPQPAQANGWQGRQSMNKESWLAVPSPPARLWWTYCTHCLPWPSFLSEHIWLPTNLLWQEKKGTMLPILETGRNQ
jgi:hypothetical protein